MTNKTNLRRRYRRLPEWLATKVRLRDQGVCANCGVNTATLQPPWPTGPGLIASKEETVYNIDHVIPIEVWPAGELILENLQTLCIACHRQKTSAQRAQTAERRRKARMIKILRLLEDSPKLAGTIATVTRLPRRSAVRLLRIMLNQGLIRQERRCWPYQITGQGRRFLAESVIGRREPERREDDDEPFVEIFL